jgi:hypothetical protein
LIDFGDLTEDDVERLIQRIDELPDGSRHAAIAGHLGCTLANLARIATRFPAFAAACTTKAKRRTRRVPKTIDEVVVELTAASATLIGLATNGDERPSIPRLRAQGRLMDEATDILKAQQKEIRTLKSRLNETQALYARLRSGVTSSIHSSGRERP